jgi:sulfate-transporting ATPase
VQQVIQFAILGLGAGSLYALTSQGLILIYRSSGVLNFAHGAIGMFGAFVAWEAQYNVGMPFAVALVVGMLTSAVLGALTYLVVMRQLRQAAPLARIVATLGVLLTIQAVALLIWGPTERFLTSELPRGTWEPFGVLVPIDRLILLAIAAAISVGLWAAFRFTKFGLATIAVSENQRWAAAIGLSPNAIATANWTLASALAGLAAILIAPIISLQVTVMTDLVLAALAAALVAGFVSFPIALTAGVGIGVAQSLIGRYVLQPGLSSSVPFILIILVLVVRGKGLPLRDFMLQRLPSVGTGTIRWKFLVPVVAVAIVGLFLLPAQWVDGFTITFGFGLVLLSIVVVTGYAGQISLGQYALAGGGAFIAGRLVGAGSWPLIAAIPAACIGTAALGAVFALPAVRTRGINLAIATLGLGTALELMVFNNGKWNAGAGGEAVGNANLLGLDISPFIHPERYAIFALLCLVAAGIVVANVRRGRTGRRLLAVRTNERAAAALGINVTQAKLYAFSLSAAIAALGGVVLAFRSSTVVYPDFNNFTSISAVAWAFIGGIGYTAGPLLGATLAPGAFGTVLGDTVLGGLDRYMLLIGGLTVTILVLVHRDGIAKDQAHALAKLLRLRPRASKALLSLEKPARVEPVVAATLAVDDMTVRFGGTVAVDQVSLRILPGQIVGVIGPNGAGKTTLIDAITGFVRPSEGALYLDSNDITRTPVAGRARMGINRSFQSLELFEQSSVLENLQTACDPRDATSYVVDLVRPVDPPLPGEVVQALEDFGLADVLEERVEDLPYGQRRLLAIARAVATRPRVLLLDEPAAGLSEVETAELARLVRRLADDWGIAVLVVEHDMGFVMPICDTVVVLEFGRKIAEGTPDAVRTNPDVIRAYLGQDDADQPADSTISATGATPR